MFKKKKTYVILVIIALIVGGIYYWKSRPTKINYTTEKVKVGTIAKTVSVTGEIVPKVKANLSFKLNGKLKYLAVDVGDEVKKGEKIAVIDEGTLKDQLAKANNELKIQKKTLANMKRHEDIYSYQQKSIQRSRIKEAQDAVNLILTEIGETVLYSPIDGKIIKRNINVGENVTANRTILTVASLEEPDIKVDVPESDIASIKIGQQAKLTFDALDIDDILIGKVTEIEPASTVVQDVVYYKVKIKLNKLDNRLKIGMSVDADINVFQKNKVVIIPLRAVKTENNQEYVKILKADNAIKRINIKTGHKGDDGTVEVIEGLKGGENIVVLSSNK